MKNFFVLGLFILFLIAVQYSRGKTVDDIIDDHLNARGGLSALRNLQSVWMKGMFNNGKIKMEALLHQHQQRLAQLTIRHGDWAQHWEISPKRSQTHSGDGQWSELPAGLHEGLQLLLDIPGALADYAGKGYKASLEGIEQYQGVPCYRIKLVHASGRVLQYWINKERMLLQQCKVDFQGEANEWLNNHLLVAAPSPSTTPASGLVMQYHGYLSAEQLLFPHHVVLKMQSVGQEWTCSFIWHEVQLGTTQAASEDILHHAPNLPQA